MKSANQLDLAIMAIYMFAMVSIGFIFMRFNKGASDYFKGGNRIPWLVAGLSCFMSGFSAWTFTGAAGIAYRHGIVIALLYLGNGVTFLVGYFVFAQRWRRTRISTTMAYLVERFDETTRQTFSVATVFFQLFMGASMLYGLSLMVASTCGFPILWTIAASGFMVLVYCMLGGLWAVVAADFLQAVILMPFCLVLMGSALIRVGGLSGLYYSLPPQMVSLHLRGEFGWMFVACWTMMNMVGYNSGVMAQRYFSVDNEDSAKKVALLCAFLFFVGSFIWFIPPMAMRVVYPDVAKVFPGFVNPHETAFAAAALTLLPNGLIGIMLAAMFSSAMANLSGMFNLHAAILSKDVFQTLFAPHAGERAMLRIGRVMTACVATTVTILAVALACAGKSIFSVLVTFASLMAIAYGPAALLGLLIKRTPHWSGMASFMVGLTLGAVGTFVLGWGLVMTFVVAAPAAAAAFLGTRWFDSSEPRYAEPRERLFLRLATPIDVNRELTGSVDQTTPVFRFLSRATAAIGMIALLLLFTVPASGRGAVVAYSAITLAVAAGLAFIRGEKKHKGSAQPPATDRVT